MSARRSLRLAMLVAGAVAILAAALGVGVRTTYGGHAAVDEPQYLLSALSLWEDGDLDISDELAAQRWRAFHDTDLPRQTEVRPDGRQLSPHDPLLPLLLALPMGLGGFLAAKLALTLLAGAAAALTVWVAVRRFAVPARLAGAGAALVFAAPPLAVYGGQVYPELPAALAVLVAVAAATGPLRRRGLLLGGTAVVALPWLSVKYAPVAAALAALLVWRLARAGRRPAAGGLGAALVLAGAGYLAVHRLVWGGWTVYASGDHFTRTGEFSVVGTSPDYLGRTLRLVGLFFDRGYGLAAWAPVWTLALVAVAALARRRPPGTAALLLPIAAGWAVATWVALTMDGFWFPGRQVVVVLPLLAVAMLWWAAHLAGPAARVVAGALGAVGVVATAALVLDGWAGELTWVTGFQGVDDPIYQALRPLLPDYRTGGPALWWRHVAAIAAMAALVTLGWRSARPAGPAPAVPPRHPHDRARATRGRPSAHLRVSRTGRQDR